MIRLFTITHGVQTIRVPRRQLCGQVNFRVPVDSGLQQLQGMSIESRSFRLLNWSHGEGVAE